MKTARQRGGYFFVVWLIMSGLSQSAASAERVKIPTYTPKDYSEILSGAYKKKKAKKISGRLYLPTERPGPVPAVVIMHGSGGIRKDTEMSVSAALAKSGIATLVVDSFRGRGLSETGSDQGKLPMAATVLDGFQALLALRKHPDIQSDRIGIVGFSRGGVAAIFTNQMPLKAAVLGDAPGFAAHAPIYPGCSTQWDNVIPTSAPVRFFLGQKDDLTPAAKCQRYAKRITAGGGKADAIVYPGVSHQFLIKRKRKVRKVPNFANCNLGIRPNGEMHYPKLKIKVGGNWRKFVKKVFKHCGKKGFTQGGTKKSHSAAISDITKFFKESLVMRP